MYKPREVPAMLFNKNTRNRATNYRTKRTLGFALIEVLISMLIMAIALKGIGDYWVKTVKESEHNFSRSQALVVAQNIIEFVRVNPDGWDTYKTENNWKPANKINASCFSTSNKNLKNCTPKDMALADISLIKDYVKNHMPLLNGSIELRSPCTAGGNASCVIVAWMDTTTQQCNPLNDGTGLFDNDGTTQTNEFSGTSQCVIIDFIPEHG